MNKKNDHNADYPIFFAAMNYEVAISESIRLIQKLLSAEYRTIIIFWIWVFKLNSKSH